MAVHGQAKQGRRGTGRLCLPTRSFLARSLTDTHARQVRCRVCLAVECAFSLCPSLLRPTVLLLGLGLGCCRRWLGGRWKDDGVQEGEEEDLDDCAVVGGQARARTVWSAGRITCALAQWEKRDSISQAERLGGRGGTSRAPKSICGRRLFTLPLSIASQCQPAPVAAAASRLGLPLSRQAQHPLEPPANVYHF